MRRRVFLQAMGSGSILSFYAGASLARQASRPGADPFQPDTTDARTAATLGPHYWSWWAWEPPDAYRRLASKTGAVDGSAWWLPKWWDRLHSEDVVRMMAGLGVNLAITHFFKGFGLKHEHDEQMRTAKLVQTAHRHGIRVLGYCQSRSLYYEAFLAEEPNAEQWIQRDEFGRLRTWGAAYFRWTPCILSQEFRRYLKRVIRYGLEEIGLDGLHFDNDYAEPCYCARCQQGFRDWLTARCASRRERFGLASFEHVRVPPTQSSPSRIQDPLVQEWVRFRCESLGEYHRDITSYARSLRPGAILLANPAHPRSMDAPYRLSVWAPAVGQHLNLMFAENGNFPGIASGALISQIRAHKQGSAIGYRVVSTAWSRGRGPASGLPETPEAVCLQVAEAAANRGVPGANWTLRAAGDGDRMRIDQPDLREALRKSLRFVRANEQLMERAHAVRDVAVLHTFASLAFDARDAWNHLLGAEEVLIRGGFTWEVVFGDNLSRLDGFRVLVVAGQSYLSDQECDALAEFARTDGALVLVGENGQMDEHGRQRAQPGLQKLSGERVVRVSADSARSPVAAGYEIRVPLPKQWRKLVEAIETAAKGQLSMRLSGSDTATLSGYLADSGRGIAHLVNYGAPKPQQALRLQLGPRWKTARRARILDLDGPERELAVDRTGAGGVIELPPLTTYAVVVVER